MFSKSHPGRNEPFPIAVLSLNKGGMRHRRGLEGDNVAVEAGSAKFVMRLADVCANVEDKIDPRRVENADKLSFPGLADSLLAAEQAEQTFVPSWRAMACNIAARDIPGQEPDEHRFWLYRRRLFSRSLGS
jgi:hypothetical protein